MLQPEDTRVMADKLLSAKKPKCSRDALYRTAGLEKGKVSGFFKPSARPKKRLPGDVLAAIARVLDTTVEYLVTGKHPPHEDLPPDLQELCDTVAELDRDELMQVTGVVRQYIDSHIRGEGAVGERTAG